MNHHIAIQIGPLALRWYGLLIMGGLLAAAFVADREAGRRGENPEHVWNALIWVLALGMIGARLYHVVSTPANSTINFSYYLQNPIKILYIWEGGLGIYGAIVGGLLAVYLYVRRHRLAFLRWSDIAVVGLPLAQAIGRWGNFVNQELYGYPTTLPWGIPIDAAHRLPQFADLPPETRFHPTFLYESLWNLLTFGLLLLLARRFGHRLRQGDLLLVYGFLYPLGRILVETQRPDAWTLGGVPTAQLIGAVSIVLCAALLIWRHRGRTEKAEKVPIGLRGEKRV
jgi:phosphatidylglycerol:prolipoprotein diacylglycerol transferase